MHKNRQESKNLKEDWRTIRQLDLNPWNTRNTKCLSLLIRPVLARAMNKSSLFPRLKTTFSLKEEYRHKFHLSIPINMITPFSTEMYKLSQVRAFFCQIRPTITRRNIAIDTFQDHLIKLTTRLMDISNNIRTQKITSLLKTEVYHISKDQQATTSFAE